MNKRGIFTSDKTDLSENKKTRETDHYGAERLPPNDGNV